MNKYLSVGVISVNVVFGESCKSVKELANADFKKKMKEENEKAMEYVKSLVTDGSKVISHTNTLNSDEFLNANLLILKEANDDDKKKVVDIFEKNLGKIKNSVKYGTNSLYYIFAIKSEKFSSIGIIEIDGSTLRAGAPLDKFCEVDGLDQFKLF